ncbi:MAG: hypothetical protein H7Z38_21520 [Rubrivivax sp.]|nr:hypothetical protein [Pyrinomonadaceae bacterium]
MKKTKKWKTGRLHWPGSHHEHDGNDNADLDVAAARLAPLEETKDFDKSPQSEGRKDGTDDTIRVGAGDVRLPDQLNDEDRDAASVFRLGPVALFIVTVALAFVAFITWQITLMPAK